MRHPCIPIRLGDESSERFISLSTFIGERLPQGKARHKGAGRANCGRKRVDIILPEDYTASFAPRNARAWNQRHRPERTDDELRKGEQP